MNNDPICTQCGSYTSVCKHSAPSPSPSEMVSCIPRSDWYNSTRGVGMFQDAKLEDLLGGPFEETVELPRAACETMMDFKQIIPYIALTAGRNDNLQIVIYQRGRGCGEHRLHDKWSIGFGGHINLSKETLHEAINRELMEELELDISIDPCLLKFRGYINLERTAVDRVHLGLGYTLQLSGPIDLCRDDRPNHTEETRVSWQPYYIVAAMRESLEPWSQLLLDNILQEHGLQ